LNDFFLEDSMKWHLRVIVGFEEPIVVVQVIVVNVTKS